MQKLLKGAVLAGSLIWAALVLAGANLPGTWASLVDSTTPGQRWLLALMFLVPSAVSYWLDTWGWVFAYGPDRPATGFGRLFAVRMAGEAVNQATPFMSLGGEPVKALLLAREGESRGAVAAVASSKLVMTLAQILFVLVGLALAIPRLTAHRHLVFGIATFPALLGLVLTSLLLLRVALPASARRWVREHPRLFPVRSGLSVVAEAFGFWKRHPRAFALSFGAFLLGWAVVAAEFWVVARVVGQPLSWSEALAMEALMNSITMATFFIPGNLGSQEAGLVAVPALYGIAGPLAPLMVVLRRLRELLWIVVGLGGLSVLGRGLAPRAGTAVAAAGETQ